MKISKRDPTSSRPTLSRRNSSYFRNPAARRKPPSPTSDTFSQSDARWFLRLPDKVQRRHFTKEERNLLSGQTHSLVPDATDEAFEREVYKLSREVNRSVPTLRTSSFSSLSSLSTFDVEIEQPADSAIEMDDSMIWFDDDNDLDLDSRLQLDDYHDFINKAAESKNRKSRRGPSFRRALSLNSQPFGASTALPPNPLQTATPTPLITPHFPKNSHQRTLPRIQPQSHGKQGSVSTLEPSARHYQDPEARLKLRVYLASPQKFDEAIEFGFPSMEDKENRPLSRPSPSRAHNTAPCRTFLHDDNPSVFDALDLDEEVSNDETASLPERDCPYTPMDAAFNTEATLLSASDATSSGSSSTLISRPTIRHHSSEPFAQLLAGSREMTLRMTLTRPDLRADEKALYANTTGDDPLALEHLPPTKREEEIWDSLPKDHGIVKKLWRKVSGKV